MYICSYVIIRDGLSMRFIRAMVSLMLPYSCLTVHRASSMLDCGSCVSVYDQSGCESSHQERSRYTYECFGGEICALNE
jgi:hypothetical protein